VGKVGLRVAILYLCAFWMLQRVLKKLKWPVSVADLSYAVGFADIPLRPENMQTEFSLRTTF